MVYRGLWQAGKRRQEGIEPAFRGLTTPARAAHSFNRSEAGVNMNDAIKMPDDRKPKNVSSKMISGLSRRRILPPFLEPEMPDQPIARACLGGAQTAVSPQTSVDMKLGGEGTTR
jgi:hypothetical protein